MGSATPVEVVGFSGTSRGMTDAQAATLEVVRPDGTTYPFRRVGVAL